MLKSEPISSTKTMLMTYSERKTENAELAEALVVATGLKVVQAEPLSKHTSLRFGGPADLFATTTTTEQLVAVVRAARTLDVPYLVIGNGTNLLARDGGVRGLVIQHRAQGQERTVLDAEGEPLSQAEVSTDHVKRKTQNSELAAGTAALWRADAG